jgi:branched-chain amino acid transport system ATP-binding protein
MPSALSLQNVSVSFGGLKAVSDVSFDVPEGSIFGLIGPNGAGKTTIFNTISGVYRPSSGRILTARGSDLVGHRPHQVVAQGIARTFQNLRLFRRLSVREHVLVAHDRTATPTMQAPELLGIFNLASRADDLATELPYGDQRRLEIARALATGAKVLLLDEPAAGMNPQETQGLMETVRAIRERFKVTPCSITASKSPKGRRPKFAPFPR